MLIKLGGRGLRKLGAVSARPFVGRLTTAAERPGATEIWLATEPGPLPAGFRAYLLLPEAVAATFTEALTDCYVLDPAFSYLAAGDVIRIEPARQALHAIYRRNARTNSLLVTERCNNYCVMCSQPPKDRDDSWLVDELLQAIPLISPATGELGITGGEPGLLGPRLIDLVTCMRDCLPTTAVHILSNGRLFASSDFARQLAQVRHPDLMLGIPLYADVPEIHDYVVQARGAFDDTIRGILNLKRYGVRVELRYVIHADTYAGLPAFAEFVARNLLFVDHVALMGLELTGFARTNLDAIWIDPLDYQVELHAAIETLDRAGMRVSIYNTPLCVLDRSLHHFARASISDWKNAYLDECEGCGLRASCGGLFASSTVRSSRGIRRVAFG